MMGLSDIRHFCKNLLSKSKYGLTEDECLVAIQAACDFFGIPAPVVIQDLTNDPYGQTMFKNRDANSLYDDVLCYDLNELKGLGVSDIIGFTAVFTHECAHRVFQNIDLPGPDNGQWESELIADYFMGVRAGLQDMDIRPVRNALATTPGSGTHPLGKLRDEYIGYGFFEGRRHFINQDLPNTLDDYVELFLKYRREHLSELFEAEMVIY